MMTSKSVVKEACSFYYNNIIPISLACLMPVALLWYVPQYFISNLEGRTPEVMINVLYLLVAYPLSVAATLLVSRRISQGEPPQLGSAWAESVQRILPLAWLTIMKAFAICLGLLLLVVPGIWLAVRLSLAEMHVVFNGEGAGVAMKKSFRETDGHGWVIFGALGTFVAAAFAYEYLLGLIPSEPIVFLYIVWVASVIGSGIGALISIAAYRVSELTRPESGHN